MRTATNTANVITDEKKRRALCGLALLALTLSVASCVAAPSMGDSSVDEDYAPAGGSHLRELTGGVAATASDFPSTVLIGSNCTAAKIAPNKILTAAHCAWNRTRQTLNRLYASQRLWISSAPRPFTSDGKWKVSSDPREGLVTVRISGIYVDPAYVAATRRGGGPIDFLSNGYDLAVVVVADEDAAKLASIPISPVDFSPVEPSAPVAIMGYGCDDGLGKASTEPSHLKYARVHAIPRGEAINDQTQFNKVDSARIEKRYFFTPGLSKDRNAASLCPGDSGGPAYRLNIAGRPTGVIGVNAYYDFPKGEEARIAYSNWHTRFNDTWLRNALDDSKDPEIFHSIGDGFGTTCLGGGGTVVGKIEEKYKSLGGCTSSLGVPQDDEQGTPDGRGRYTVFGDGSIYWKEATGAHEVHGAIRDAWKESGWEAGPLGYPTSDEYAVTEGRRSDFERGTITWVAARGEAQVDVR